MKIIHFVEAFAGGVLSFLEGLTKGQVIENEVYIAYGLRPLTPQDFKAHFDSRVNFIEVKIFKGAWGTLLNPKSYLEVRRIYNNIKPDVVHLHSSSVGFVGRRVLPCSNVPVFYTPHGYAFLNQDESLLKRKAYYLMEQLTGKRKATTLPTGRLCSRKRNLS